MQVYSGERNQRERKKENGLHLNPLAIGLCNGGAQNVLCPIHFKLKTNVPKLKWPL